MLTTRNLHWKDVSLLSLHYCWQDDAVMGTLSVRENLHFSAALRLPSRMTHAERKERVERVIDELGLRRCASTKVQMGIQSAVHVTTQRWSEA